MQLEMAQSNWRALVGGAQKMGKLVSQQRRKAQLLTRKKKQFWLVVAVVVIIIIVAASASGGSKVSSGNNSASFEGCPNNCGNDFSYPGEIHTQARSRTFTSEDCQSSRNNGVTYEQCKIKLGYGSTSSSRRRRRYGNSHSYALCCPISPDPKYNN